NVLARSYILTILFLFSIAAVYKNRLEKPGLHVLLLILLANTNLHGFIVALGLSAVYLYELLSQKRDQLTVKYYIALAALGAAFAFVIYLLLPPSDLADHTAAWRLELTAQKLVNSAEVIINAFFPIVVPKVQFWNYLLSPPTPLLQGAAVALCFFPVLFFRRKILPAIIYFLPFVSLLTLFWVKYFQVRHVGLVFILFIFSVWVSDIYHRGDILQGVLVKDLGIRILNIGLIIILAYHVFYGAVATYVELGNDFSAASKAASFINEQNYGEETLIVAFPSYDALSVLAQVQEQHKTFYSVEIEDQHSYAVWNKEYFDNWKILNEEVLKRIKEVSKESSHERIILIAGSYFTRREAVEDELKLLASYPDSVEKSEGFCVYEFRDVDGEE
ncbi:hypothetical protein ACFL2M_02440, partial [Patescibacteria group bacterium]